MEPGAPSKLYGSAMTIAPAAFIRSKSPATSLDSMFQMSRPGRGVPALDLAVRPDRHEPGADLPARVTAVRERRRAEDLAVVLDEPLRVLGPDEDAVEIHAFSVPCSLLFCIPAYRP